MGVTIIILCILVVISCIFHAFRNRVHSGIIVKKVACRSLEVVSRYHFINNPTDEYSFFLVVKAHDKRRKHKTFKLKITKLLYDLVKEGDFVVIDGDQILLHEGNLRKADSA